MRLPTWNYERQVEGWQTGIIVCPGLWTIGAYWEDDRIHTPSDAAKLTQAATAALVF
jgi:hypothetical protein